MAIRAIIFDCFGVLVLNGGDSLRADFPQHVDAMHDLFVRADYGYMDKNEYVSEICALTGLTPEEYQTKYWGKKIRNAGFLQWIDELRSQGFKVGLLSNVYRDGIDDFFTREERDTIFDAAVLSFELHMQKPSEEVYVETARRLGVEPTECVMIDDTPSFIEGAKKTGMHTVLYTTSTEVRRAVGQIIAEQEHA